MFGISKGFLFRSIYIFSICFYLKGKFDEDGRRLRLPRTKAISEPTNPKATTDSQGSISGKTKIAPVPPTTGRVDTGLMGHVDSGFIDLRKRLDETQAVQMNTLLSFPEESDESTEVKKIYSDNNLLNKCNPE